MRKHYILTTTLLVSGLFGMSAAVMAQSSSQTTSSEPPASNPSSAPTPSTSASTTPGTAPNKDKSKQGSTTAASASQSATPDAPQVRTAKPSPADENEFPEEVSAKAAAAAKAEAHDAAAPDAPMPTSPAEKQAQGSSSLDNTDKLGLDDPTRKLLKIESPDGTTDVYDPKRATEDVRVGKFYLQTGYLKGAYDRFKDATIFDHENVEAVFYLAEAARKLNLPQEAEQNYQLYLAAVPDGPSAKAARKALGELGTSSKP